MAQLTGSTWVKWSEKREWARREAIGKTIPSFGSLCTRAWMEGAWPCAHESNRQVVSKGRRGGRQGGGGAGENIGRTHAQRVPRSVKQRGRRRGWPQSAATFGPRYDSPLSRSGRNRTRRVERSGARRHSTTERVSNGEQNFGGSNSSIDGGR